MTPLEPTNGEVPDPVRAPDAERETESPADAGLSAPNIETGPSPSGHDTSVTWTFTADPGATTECRLDRDGVVLEPFSPCTSPVSYDLFAAGDGRYTFTVRAVRDGDVSEPAVATYVLAVAEVVDEESPGDIADVFPGLGGLSNPPQDPAGPDSGHDPAAGPGEDVSASTGASAVLRRVGQLAVVAAEKTAFPFVLWLVMLAFLAVQDRIDRGDPKLALAPVQGEPDLDFPPRPNQPGADR